MTAVRWHWITIWVSHCPTFDQRQVLKQPQCYLWCKMSISWVYFCFLLLLLKLYLSRQVQNTFLFTPITWEVNCGGGCVTHYSFANTHIYNDFVLLVALLEQLGAKCHVQRHIKNRLWHSAKLTGGVEWPGVQLRVQSPTFMLATKKSAKQTITFSEIF